jgi:hypothetical protein
MTRDDLKAKLEGLKPGEGARVPYDLYAMLFPPGEPDQGARKEAYDFAKALNVKIDNRPDDNAVWFFRDA